MPVQSKTLFSNLLKGAIKRVLVYPCNSQSEGPIWSPNGEIMEFKDGHFSESSLSVVKIGVGKFRLAENPCFDDLTTLFWGDEFYATETQSGELQINKIALPLKFKHQTSIVGGKIDLNSEYFKKIVESGGNWELIAGGFLITSVPVDVLK